jgi:hypothetical protein
MATDASSLEVSRMDENKPLNREMRRHPEQALREDPDAKNNPALEGTASDAAHDSVAGRPDQDVTHNLSTGSGGATEHGGGNKNHPSRIASSTPAGQKR